MNSQKYKRMFENFSSISHMPYSKIVKVSFKKSLNFSQRWVRKIINYHSKNERT